MKFSVLLAGVAAAALMVSGAQAADLVLPPAAPAPVYDASVFGFDGFYAGFQGGLITPNQDADSGFGLVGVVAGVNFAVSDAIMAGAEVQVNGYFGGDDNNDDSGFYASDVLLQGKIGALVTDEVMVYALGGVGFSHGDDGDDHTFGTVGVGAEVAVTDSISIRGEAALVKNFEDGGDGNNFDDFDQSAGKFTVGVLFHF